MDYNNIMKLTTELAGKVFNIQRFSIQDGPGIRTTVFMKGCPLNCLWCSNPESQSPDSDIAHRDSLCTGCGDCIPVCEEKAIRLSPNKDRFRIKINRERCVSCGKCVDTCLAEALKAYGQTLTVDEVFDEVKRDIDFYSRSEGGVTAGGGEPLMQADFVTELFRRCREIGIHTTLDTSGHGTINALKKVLVETAGIKDIAAKITN
jgi:pyruvate formate lyase activating enzyme